ncbi:MAG: 2-amino-4-hydroxy-6-hydroxymethyldihydropteridine diphosphokinase [Alphaproteobacteria bacterium]|nr:2-amino-4-hydroxy-6-hydroxymethyldihydropteridine diphosphokinase [Alphaproteobacteria bacterium]
MNDNELGTQAIVALGSNIGDKIANIDKAVQRLTGADDIRLTARSRDYKTPPWGNTDQDWFVNACIAITTDLGPHDLLRRCLEVEQELGRRRTEKWGPRVIDLDVLIYGDVTLADADLTLPHPHITKRAFVLAPLADVAPETVIEGKTAAEWLAEIDTAGIEPIK